MRLADVVVDRTVGALDRSFTYALPDAIGESLGYRVKVPLGHGQAVGIVVAVREGDPSPELREVMARLDSFPVLTEPLLEMAGWMAERYLCYLPQALRAMVPSGVRRGMSPRPQDPWYQAVGSRVGRLSQKQTVFDYLRQHGPTPRSVLKREMPGAIVALRALVAEASVEAMDAPRRAPSSEPSLVLTAEQEVALAAIGQGKGRAWLLEGVTGSGKTEIYLRVIQQAIQRGQQALVLIPEIALTPQTESRFRMRFGDAVRVWHSGLTDSERVNTWHQVRLGQAQVVVGARSAIFLPCPRLGVVVLDEEHEPSYKQDEHPRYHTRDLALWRGKHEGARIVMGSATPSLEMAYRARRGEIGHLLLHHRAAGQTMPTVEVVDMREELRAGHREIFSRKLIAGVTEALLEKQQVILFLNRRGYATFVLCRECGQAVDCPHCAVTLTFHQGQNRLECHYCFYQAPVPTQCAHCGSDKIRYFGAGTEKVVEEVHRFWPEARVLRADRDAILGREAYTELYRRFLAGDADVLVGTQMIAKGMDFPRVTVVGVVAADVALNLPDFRSAERTFQLLVQAGGRAGRGEHLGHVVIQTYNPQHYAIAHAETYDFEGFFAQEISFRETLGYPPFRELWLVEVEGDDTDLVLRRADAIALELRCELADEVEVLGPAPAPLLKVRGRYRYHLLIKSHQRATTVAARLKALSSRGDGVKVTRDPYFML